MKQRNASHKVPTVDLLSDADAIEQVSNELMPYVNLFQHWGCEEAFVYMIAVREELFRFAKQMRLRSTKDRPTKEKHYG